MQKSFFGFPEVSLVFCLCIPEQCC